MNRCESCNLELTEKFGSGRFCNRKCAASFSTKVKRAEINAKVSKTLKVDHILQERICIFCTSTFSCVETSTKKFCSLKCSRASGVFTNTGGYKVKDSSKMGGLRDGGGKSTVYPYENHLGEAMKLNKEEIQVAKILDTLKLNWQRNWKGFPYKTLDGSDRNYYPDFYVNDFNTYVEYKGYVTEDMTHKMSDAVSRNALKLVIIYSNNKRYAPLGINLAQIEENNQILFEAIKY